MTSAEEKSLKLTAVSVREGVLTHRHPRRQGWTSRRLPVRRRPVHLSLF